MVAVAMARQEVGQKLRSSGRSCSLSVGLLRSVGRYGKVRGVAAGHDQSPDRSGERAERRAARQAIGDYHEAQLRLLLDRVTDGFARLDTGGIDVFELDELIHRYKRSARELWKFCGQTGSDGSRPWGCSSSGERRGRSAGLVGRRRATPLTPRRSTRPVASRCG